MKKKLSEKDLEILRSRGKVVNGFTTVRDDGFVDNRVSTVAPAVKSDKNTIIDKVHKVLEHARVLFKYDFELPTIKFTKKGRVAGTANWYSNTLNFNMVLYKENMEHFLKTTIPHECSHLFANALYGKSYKRIAPHGREWKYIMSKLGYTPKRCHTYDTSNSACFHKAKYVYKCYCNYHTVSIVVHRKLEKGVRYSCRKCKGRLIFVKYAGKVSHEDAIKGL